MSTNHKDIKIHALTRKTLVKIKKKPAVNGWSFLLLTSISLVNGIEKKKDFSKKIKFHCLTSKTLVSIESFFRIWHALTRFFLLSECEMAY